MTSRLNPALTLLLLNSVCSPADFTIGVIPDTQFLSETTAGASLFSAMTQFFVDRKDSLNVKFVVSVGDMTQNQCVAAEWARAKAAYDLFVPTNIAYAPCLGNHDALSCINSTFPVSQFSMKPYWGGSYGGIENSYYLFGAEGMQFVLVVHNYIRNSGAEAWVNSTFATYRNRRGIYAVHTGISKAVATEDRMVAPVVTPNDNLFLGVQGHLCETNGEEYWTNRSVGGKTQHMIRTDYQCRSNLGAIIRYYTFKPALNQICAFTYDISTRQYEVDAGSQFCFTYDMTPTAIERKPGQKSPVLVTGSMDVSKLNNPTSVRIYDMAGKWKLTRMIGQGQASVSFPELESGHYLASFATTAGAIQVPIVLIP